MARFVSLINWTEQGVRSFAQSVDRASKAQELAQKFGGRLEATYWTLGQYDIVAVMEFPDEQAVTAFALSLGSMGNVRTNTLPAFTADEMRDIVARTT